MLVGVYAGLGWLAWLNRRRPLALAALLVALAFYALCAHTCLHQALFIAMGHGAELLFAAVCFYRVFSGDAIAHGLERAAYAMVGTFIIVNCFLFGWGVLTDETTRIIYEQGLDKDGFDHDFIILSRDYGGRHLEYVLVAFLVACPLPPILALLAHWLQSPGAGQGADA